MGFRNSYIITPIAPRDLVQPLGFQLGIETDALPYDEWWVGTLQSNGLTVFWSEAQDFVDDIAADLAKLSQNGEVYACAVNEDAMNAQAVCYAGGHEKWRIEWHGENGLDPVNLVASGALPEKYADIVQEQADAVTLNPQKDYYFEVPLEVVSAAAGFRHDYDMTNKAFSRFFRITEATGTVATAQKKGFLAKLLGR